MARMQFGGGPQDVYLFEDTEGDLHAGGGFNALMFDGPDSSATPITDLLNEDNQPVTYITTSDGGDGRAAGQLPIFYGPNNVYEMWTSINGSPRQLLSSTNVGSYLGPTKTAVDTLLSSGNTNPFSTALTSLVGVDGAGLDAASPGTTLVKKVDGTYGPGAAPVPLTDTVWVAASNAPGNFAGAPYQCDGTADDVQIQQAINNALGLKVGLSPGTFNLAAPISLVGSDDVATRVNRYLRGSGMRATVLNVGSGVAQGITLGNVVSPFVSDLRINVTGASHGIYSTRSANAPASNRSFQQGELRNIAVTGPNNATHTGWAFKLGSGSQFVAENLEITGVGNGIQVLNESSAFNCGDAVFTRCSVELSGANGTAYNVSATAGTANQIVFNTCHGYAAAGYTGQTCWKFDGAGQVAHIRAIDSNAKDFNTTISIAAACYDIDLDMAYVTQIATSTFAQVAGSRNRIRAGNLYVASGTVTAINESNAYTVKPNEFDLDLFADAGTVVNASLTTGVVVRGLVDGTGTVANVLRQYPGSTRRVAGPWTIAGSLSGKVGAGPFSWYNDSSNPVFIRSVRATVGTAPTGAPIIVDVNVSGSTVFTTQANRPTIPIGGTGSGKVTNMNLVAVPAGGRISVDLDQVGSTVAGSDLVVQVEVS